jgi:hypothetical protein
VLVLVLQIEKIAQDLGYHLDKATLDKFVGHMDIDGTALCVVHVLVVWFLTRKLAKILHASQRNGHECEMMFPVHDHVFVPPRAQCRDNAWPIA